MNLLKAEINLLEGEGYFPYYVLAVTNDEDQILTASLFKDKDDLEQAKTFMDGLLVRLNLIPASRNPPLITVKELKKKLGITSPVNTQRIIPDDEILY